MGDDDVRRLERHLESLLAEYGVLKVQQIRHEERIDEAKSDRTEIRVELRTLETELLAAIGRSEQRTREHIDRVNESCQSFRSEYRRDREKASERLAQERENARKQLAAELAKARELAQADARDDKEWSRRRKLAVAGALVAFATGVVGSIITAAVTIFGGG